MTLREKMEANAFPYFINGEDGEHLMAIDVKDAIAIFKDWLESTPIPEHPDTLYARTYYDGYTAAVNVLAQSLRKDKP
ncbi:hypothetical protein [Henriciella aquimarina]|uniref:hypothetical protein n=1 Tax=Henriciella aquimarina TaxID=545261 RepID=UPI000A062580|nr:hypothetical protein [Henriciella aquimarina]